MKLNEQVVSYLYIVVLVFTFIAGPSVMAKGEAPIAQEIRAIDLELKDILSNKFPIKASQLGIKPLQLPLNFETNEQTLPKIDALLKRLNQVTEKKLGNDKLLQILESDLLRLKAEFSIPQPMLELGPNLSELDQLFILGSGNSEWRFNSVEDYELWLDRLKAFPAVVERSQQRLLIGVESKLLPSRTVVENELRILKQHLVPSYENSLLYAPITKMPRQFLANQKQYLILQYSKVIDSQVLPALSSYIAFIENDYLPLLEEHSWYRQVDDSLFEKHLQEAMLKDQTMDALMSQALTDIDRLSRSFSELRKAHSDARSDQDFYQSILSNQWRPVSDVQSTQIELVNWLKSIHKQLPKLFNHFPRSTLKLTFQARVGAPVFRYSAAQMQPVRAATLQLNWISPATANHALLKPLVVVEGSPGRHFQYSLAQEFAPDLSYRALLPKAAIELGWSLYALTLVDELQAFDSYSEVGVVLNQLMASAQLVAIIAQHQRGWSSESVERLLRQTLPLSEQDISQLVHSTLVSPGLLAQRAAAEAALRQLRQRAEIALKGHFNLADFHGVILTQGNLSIPLLEQAVDHWIDEQRQLILERESQEKSEAE
ncbi:DUF885 family protein [Pleionea litopenaei]|uniref:DUF885 family protein n=1 Tax=Pleionea litopenaei TaxID=3070815 RepID=A0AA51RVW3_9GAMM|nr:DUF885 family protein [Pleionea sp. HL-JVS1]WMS88542.1 DUF885 family protein [Pleionea sp. HL-JVS1]